MDGNVVWPVLYLVAGVAVVAGTFGWWLNNQISGKLSMQDAKLTEARHDLRGEFHLFVAQSEERLLKRIEEIENARKRSEDDVKYEIRALRELLERLFMVGEMPRDRAPSRPHD